MELDRLSDDDLVARVKEIATQEREATAELIRSLMEVETRRLHLRQGCPSLYVWCTEVIGLGEGAAYHRIEVARAARRVPQLADALAEGSLTLSSARVLAPHVTPENWTEVIEQARHKSKREVERLVAGLHPQPEQPWSYAHVSPGRVRLHVTISDTTCDKLRRAQELLRHASPDGDLEEVLDRGASLLIADLERRRFGATGAPRPPRPATPGSRHIPAWLRRAVVERDAGQCAFIGALGRCPSRGLLEFHHREPHAVGGEVTLDNIELRCRQHNQYEAEEYFGTPPADAVREDTLAYRVSAAPSKRPALFGTTASFAREALAGA
jgi:hypothetical protein